MKKKGLVCSIMLGMVLLFAGCSTGNDESVVSLEDIESEYVSGSATDAGGENTEATQEQENTQQPPTSEATNPDNDSDQAPVTDQESIPETEPNEADDNTSATDPSSANPEALPLPRELPSPKPKEPVASDQSTEMQQKLPGIEKCYGPEEESTFKVGEPNYND